MAPRTLTARVTLAVKTMTNRSTSAARLASSTERVPRVLTRMACRGWLLHAYGDLAGGGVEDDVGSSVAWREVIASLSTFKTSERPSK